MTDRVTSFLNGDTSEIRSELTAKMQEASAESRIRTGGGVPQSSREYQQYYRGYPGNIEKDSMGNFDVFSWFTDRGYLAVTGLLVRRGVVLNRNSDSLRFTEMRRGICLLPGSVLYGPSVRKTV